MKKIYLLVVLFVSTVSFAQQEVKIDLFDALVFKTLDVSYEYYLNDDSSIGASLFHNFSKKSASFRYNEKTSFSPYFRHYFSGTSVWSLFGETFIGVGTGDKEITEKDKKTYYKTYTDGYLGIGAGIKYIAGAGLVIDAYAGLGRNLFSENSPLITPRLGVGVGYSF